MTGAAGFIGAHTIIYLRRAGFEIRGIDNFSRYNPRMFKLLRKDGIEVENADIRNYDELMEILKGFDAVVHAAALISVDESVREPVLYSDNNVNGTVTLLKASVDAGINKFIFISSAAVYGHPIKLPIKEDHPLNPISPYGASKVAGEIFVKAFSGAYDLKYIVLRLFNVYGPGQVSNEYAGVITKFIERVRKGKPPIIYGDGEQVRDFIHVDDVVKAIERSLIGTVSNEIFNIGTGTPTKIKDLAKLVIEIAGLNVEPIHTKERPGDIRESCADVGKARDLLNWEARIGLDEGLKELFGNKGF